MKKIVLIAITLFAVVALSACEDVCVGTECITGESNGASELDNVLTFTHINGEGHEEEYNAFILYEWEGRDYVKYQITYLSCTCRDAIVNYWQVAFVEVNKYSNDIKFISFDRDNEDHYTAGMWGDSSPTPSGKTFDDFKSDFIPWLTGKSLEDLEGISVFTNEDYFGIQNTTNIDEQDLIDSYAGSSVSTNNMIRAFKELLNYHADKYSE